MHISITGDLGSGKSSVAKEICNNLNYKYLSTGLLQRELGLQKGMNTLEFNKYTDKNLEIDDYIDQKLKDINNSSDLYLLDSRLAWFFVNKSFKVYLMALDEVAALRVLIDEKRIGEPMAVDIKSKIKDQKERRTIENERFKKYYGIEPDIFTDFDVVIDTSTASITDVKNLILLLFDKWKNGEVIHKIWLSPLRIFPTENIRLIASDEAQILLRSVNLNGYDENFPVSCVLYKEEFYVYDGHKRLSAAIFNKNHFIPVNLIAKDSGLIFPSCDVFTFVKDSLNISWLYDWEDAHNFKFYHYPAITENV